MFYLFLFNTLKKVALNPHLLYYYNSLTYTQSNAFTVIAFPKILNLKSLLILIFFALASNLAQALFDERLAEN